MLLDVLRKPAGLLKVFSLSSSGGWPQHEVKREGEGMVGSF